MEDFDVRALLLWLSCVEVQDILFPRRIPLVPRLWRVLQRPVGSRAVLRSANPETSGLAATQKRMEWILRQKKIEKPMVSLHVNGELGHEPISQVDDAHACPLVFGGMLSSVDCRAGDAHLRINKQRNLKGMCENHANFLLQEECDQIPFLSTRFQPGMSGRLNE